MKKIITLANRFMAVLQAPMANQRGELLTATNAVLFVAALIAAAYAARPHSESYNFKSELDRCIAQMETSAKKLKERIDENTDPNKPLIIDLNDPDWLELKKCQDLVESAREIIKTKNQASVDNYTKLIGNIPESVGSCSITSYRKESLAGLPYATDVRANIPFYGGLAMEGNLGMTGAVSADGSLRLPPVNPPTVVGNFAIPAEQTERAGGQSSLITISAKAPAFASPIVDRNTLQVTCPPSAEVYSRDPEGKPSLCAYKVNINNMCLYGQKEGTSCVVACDASASVTWKAPPPPKVIAFSVLPSSIEKGSTEQVRLAWQIANARSAGIDQGVGDVAVDPTKTVTGTIPIATSDASTTYTLAAFGIDPAASDFKTATLTVKPAGQSLGIAITSPRAGDQIADVGVTVAGSVTPAPKPGETMKAKILVNGAYLSDADVGTNGAFSARTALMNTIEPGNVNLGGDASVSAACTPLSKEIGITASGVPGAGKNLIRVVVTGQPTADHPEGQTTSASVQVQHVLDVQNFSVQWGGGCPGMIGKNQALGWVLTPGQGYMRAGSVDFTGYPDNSSVKCDDVATVRLTTSAGTFTAPQAWKVSCTSTSSSCTDPLYPVQCGSSCYAAGSVCCTWGACSAGYVCSANNKCCPAAQPYWWSDGLCHSTPDTTLPCGSYTYSETACQNIPWKGVVGLGTITTTYSGLPEGCYGGITIPPPATRCCVLDPC